MRTPEVQRILMYHCFTIARAFCGDDPGMVAAFGMILLTAASMYELYAA